MSAATHFIAFVFLCPLGLRRLLCCTSVFLSNPSLYRSKPWFFSEPRWKNIDFFALLLALPIASFSYIFFFLALSGNPIFRFSFLQQSLVIFLFWILLIVIICKESLNLLAIPESFIFICAGIAFLLEYSMTGEGIVGLGGVMYDILGALALLCGACCLYLSIKPSAFFVDFLFSGGLVLKGTWVLQVGLSLYTDAFVVKGCEPMSMTPANGEYDVDCKLDENRLRGMALLNFVFVVHVIVVMIISFLMFGSLNRTGMKRSLEASGPLLSRIGSESSSINQMAEFEIE